MFELDIGNAMLSIIGFCVVWILNGIKQEITSLSKALIELDRRVIVLETKNRMENTNGHCSTH